MVRKRPDQGRGAVAVLELSSVDLSGDGRATDVGENVTRVTLDLLARIKASRTTTLPGFNRLAIDNPTRCLPPSLRRCLQIS